jgi:hypothetical protein
VLFAAAIAVIVLKEPLQRPRIIAAVMIVAGWVDQRCGCKKSLVGAAGDRMAG